MKSFRISRKKRSNATKITTKNKKPPLEAFFEQTSHLILQRYSLDGTIQYWNEASEALYGYQSEEVVGKNLVDLIVLPEDRVRVQKELKVMELTGQPISQREMTLRRKDGFLVQVYTNFILTESPDTSQLELLCLDIDLTREKKRQHELRQMESKTRRKLEAILEPDGDIDELAMEDVLDIPSLREMMYEMNRATGLLAALLDLSGNVLIDYGWQEICTRFHRKHLETSKHCWKSDVLLAAKTVPGIYEKHKCANGLWDLALPVMVGERRVGTLFFGQFFYEDEDIDLEFFQQQAHQYGFPESDYMAALEKVPRLSREKVEHIMKFYDHLIRNNTSLEYTNLQLTRNLEQQQLLEQQLLASIQKVEKANEVKDRFMANMSHELRTPLNGLMGMLQLVEMTEITEEQREFIEQALQSCQSLTDVVADILNHTDLVKREEEELKEKSFTLRNLMQEVLELHQVTAFQKRLAFHLKVASKVPEELLGDRYKIKQILNNLVGNAVKFTEQGHIHLCADLEKETDHQEVTLKLRVMDTGTGIPSSLHEHIFQAFAQADSSSTRAHDGLGLGLATVKKLAERMGGSVTLQSTPGKGSTFTVSIKAKKLPSEHREDHTLKNPERNLQKNIKILVVDDDAMNRKLVKLILHRDGYQVETATDGVEALKKANEKPYALILMDLHMPGQDGFDATKAILQRSVNSDTPVIAVTAMDLPDIKKRCLEAGMKDLVMKPIKMEEFKWKVQGWIK